MDTKLHVVVADEDEYVRQDLREFLSSRPAVETISEADHGSMALELIDSNDPDLVFLDVEMPAMSGLQVIEEVGPGSMPTTILMSTQKKFAVQAFELAAVDYLLKPFERERFNKAFNRAREAVTLEQVEDLASRFQTLLSTSNQRTSLFADGFSGPQNGAVESSQNGSQSGYLERLTVEARGQIHVIPVEDIRYVTAEDTYVRIHTDERNYLLRKRLYEMEQELDPAEFARIHRSTIVRLDCVQRLLQRSAGDYVVQLDDTKTLRVSRSRQEELIERLETGTSV